MTFRFRSSTTISRQELCTEKGLQCGELQMWRGKRRTLVFLCYYKMIRFKSLEDVVLHRNICRDFLPGIERSDSLLRLNRHRFARRADITAKTSSLERNALGVNNRWKADNFNSCKIERAKTQNPQSSTLYESNCSFFLL